MKSDLEEGEGRRPQGVTVPGPGTAEQGIESLRAKCVAQAQGEIIRLLAKAIVARGNRQSRGTTIESGS